MFLIDDRTVAVHRALAQRKYSTWLSPADLARLIVPGRLRMAAVVAAVDHFAAFAGFRMWQKEHPVTSRIARIHSVSTPTDELVDALNDHRPAILVGYARSVAQLAEQKEAGRLAIDPVLVIVTAESLAGSPAPPGEASSTVLLTKLANRVQPIIRYDLGDSIEPLPDYCSCGSPLPAFRVQGRSSQVMTLETDGTRISVPPMAYTALLERIRGAQNYQVVQTGPGRVSIRFRTAAEQEADDVWREISSDVERLLADHGADDVVVERAREHPQMSEGGKYPAVIPLDRA